MENILAPVVELYINPRLPPDWEVTRADIDAKGNIVFRAVRSGQNEKGFQSLLESIDLGQLIQLLILPGNLPTSSVFCSGRDVLDTADRLLRRIHRFPFLKRM